MKLVPEHHLLICWHPVVTVDSVWSSYLSFPKFDLIAARLNPSKVHRIFRHVSLDIMFITDLLPPNFRFSEKEDYTEKLKKGKQTILQYSPEAGMIFARW